MSVHTVNREELLKFLLEHHKPELLQHPESGDGGMVYQVWEDGEITLQKGGSLLGHRRLHCIMPPHVEVRDYPLLLPMKMGIHSYVVLPSEHYETVQKMIWGF